MTLAVGLEATVTVTVGPSDTAQALGSGDVPVLATPRLLALAEAATVRAVAGHLAPGETSVGTRVHLEHVRAVVAGQAVTVRARLTDVDGRLLSFDVVAHDADARVVGHGEVTRAVVDRARFLARLPRGST